MLFLNHQLLVHREFFQSRFLFYINLLSKFLNSFPTPPVTNLATSLPMQQTPVPPPPPPQGKLSFIHIQRITLILVIIPPPPVSLSIPQPTLLEEPPIPVGLKVDLQSPQQQQYPSIALVLPTNKSDSNGNQKTTTDSKPSEDVSATLSQQEELSIKGLFNSFHNRQENGYSFLRNLGREQRHLLMQKLSQHRFDSHVCVLKNMVGPEEVDDDLQQEITGKFRSDSNYNLFGCFFFFNFFRRMFEIW
jgi:hypothetical protein